MSAKEIVLDKLKKAKNKGIMITDFPSGFRLGARIKELRDVGNDILTIMEEDFTNGYKRKIARYVLK